MPRLSDQPITRPPPLQSVQVSEDSLDSRSPLEVLKSERQMSKESPDTIQGHSSDNSVISTRTRFKEQLREIYASTARFTPILTKSSMLKIGVGLLCIIATSSYSLLRTKMSEDDFHRLQRSTAREAGTQYMNIVQRQLETSVSSTRAVAALVQLDHGEKFFEPLAVEVQRLVNATMDLTEASHRNSSATTLDLYAARKKEAAQTMVAKSHLAKFNSVAESLITTYRGISNLQLAPGGVVSIIHPLAGNEGAIGHDLLFDAKRREGAMLTIKARSVVFVGPINLIQNGKAAIIARYPVFISSSGFVGTLPQHPGFWGFTTMLVELDFLFKSMPLASLQNSRMSYVLYAVKGDKNIFISASPTVPGIPVKATDDPGTPWLSFALKQDPESVSFTLPDMHVHWVVQLWPEESWQEHSDTFVLQIVLCGFFVATSLTSMYGVVLRDSALYAIRHGINAMDYEVASTSRCASTS